jgi:hypothetical protein
MKGAQYEEESTPEGTTVKARIKRGSDNREPVYLPYKGPIL